MFEFRPHTGDIRVHVAAFSLEALYAEAIQAMMVVLEAQPRSDAARVRRRITVHSADRTALLVDFLNEVLALAAIAGEAFSDVHFDSFDDDSLDAEVDSRSATFGDEIKAVTYTEAEVVRHADGTWSTLLVFDM